jgi:hypothetical protein
MNMPNIHDMSFDERMALWDQLSTELAANKRAMAQKTATEMELRKMLFGSIGQVMELKEGVNKYTHPVTGKTLKVTRTIKREIDVGLVQHSRDLFGQVNETPGASFDDLLRLKYELDKRAWKKLGDAHLVAVSHMVTAKEQAPKLEWD